jgi:hypothetical protein
MSPRRSRSRSPRLSVSVRSPVTHQEVDKKEITQAIPSKVVTTETIPPEEVSSEKVPAKMKQTLLVLLQF